MFAFIIDSIVVIVLVAYKYFVLVALTYKYLDLSLSCAMELIGGASIAHSSDRTNNGL